VTLAAIFSVKLFRQKSIGNRYYEVFEWRAESCRRCAIHSTPRMTNGTRQSSAVSQPVPEGVTRTGRPSLPGRPGRRRSIAPATASASKAPGRRIARRNASAGLCRIGSRRNVAVLGLDLDRGLRAGRQRPPSARATCTKTCLAHVGRYGRDDVGPAVLPPEPVGRPGVSQGKTGRANSATSHQTINQAALVQAIYAACHAGSLPSLPSACLVHYPHPAGRCPASPSAGP